MQHLLLAFAFLLSVSVSAQAHVGPTLNLLWTESTDALSTAGIGYGLSVDYPIGVTGDYELHGAGFHTYQYGPVAEHVLSAFVGASKRFDWLRTGAEVGVVDRYVAGGLTASGTAVVGRIRFFGGGAIGVRFREASSYYGRTFVGFQFILD